MPYSDIQKMIDDAVEKKVSAMLDERFKELQDNSLYGVPDVIPYHVHNGIDSPLIDLTPNATSTTPGGSTTQIQYNSSGAFAGDSTFTFNGTTHVLTVKSIVGNSGSALVIGSTGNAALNLSTGDGSGSTAGGDVTLTSGNGGASGDGGKITITMGSGVNFSTGVITYFPTTGELRHVSPSALTGNTDGGDFTYTLSAGFGTGSYGDFIITPGVSTTTRKGGFLIMPVSNGTPTGTPTNASATVAPIVYDNSNNKLWVYNGSWRGIVLV